LPVVAPVLLLFSSLPQAESSRAPAAKMLSAAPIRLCFT
jgi:hypothetical protein